MAATFVQQASTVGTTGPITVTLGVAPTTGNLLVAVAGSGYTSGGESGVFGACSGGGVTTWRVTQTGNGMWNGTGCDIWWGFVDTTPSTAVTLSAGSLGTGEYGTQVTVAEFSGLKTVSAVDTSGVTNITKASSTPTASVTPTATGDLFVAAASCGAPGSTLDAAFSAGSVGWTALGATGHAGWGQYLIATDSAAHSDTFTLSTANENSATVIVAFAPVTTRAIGWGVVV